MVMVSESVCVTTGWTEAALVVIAETAAAKAARGVGSPTRPVASSWKVAVSLTVPEEISFHEVLEERSGIFWFPFLGIVGFA